MRPACSGSSWARMRAANRARAGCGVSARDVATDVGVCPCHQRSNSARLSQPDQFISVTRWQHVAQRISLEALARQQLERAAATSGHAADTVVGGHERVLRQTVIGLTEGSELGEHENPGEATVHVLRGRVRLSSGDESWEGRAGDLLKVPNARHSLQALEDSAVLLTVAKLP